MKFELSATFPERVHAVEDLHGDRDSFTNHIGDTIQLIISETGYVRL